MGTTAPYPLQLRGRHRDPRPHPAARPGGVRKHKKGRSRQLRPIHLRRMKTTKKDECSYSVSNAIRTLAMAPLPESDTIWRKGRGDKIRRGTPPFSPPRGKMQLDSFSPCTSTLLSIIAMFIEE